VKGPSPARLRTYFCQRLRLGWYLDDPGDGRTFPQIPARTLLWALLLGKMLRIPSHLGVESLAAHAGRSLGVAAPFSDDTLSYFTARLDPDLSRRALAVLLRRAKRGKAFEGHYIGLAMDGTGSGRSAAKGCDLCHRQGNGWGHKWAAISVVGAGLDLPFDCEPFGPGDSELSTSSRMLVRSVTAMGRRFADYAVVDALYANAPFLHLCEALDLPVIASLKGNLPELFEAAQIRFRNQAPHGSFSYRGGRVEVWDAHDFEPWLGLRWSTVRVLRYRHYRSDGKVFEAYWLTNFFQISSFALFHLCKSRWAIENQGFNDAKNRYGLEHVPHHQENALLINALLTFLAMGVERLYRLRYLRRGTHRPYTAIQFNRLLWISLGRPVAYDTS
jgi:hypothetical protein